MYMSQIFSAIYEDGVFKPLRKINLKEHQKIKLKIELEESAVMETKALIKLPRKTIKQIAESDEFIENS